MRHKCLSQQRARLWAVMVWKVERTVQGSSALGAGTLGLCLLAGRGPGEGTRGATLSLYQAGIVWEALPILGPPGSGCITLFLTG